MFVFVFDDSWEAWQNVLCVLCFWPPGLELREEKSGTISFRVLQKPTTSHFQFVFSAALWTCNQSRFVCIHFCFVLREQSVNITTMKCFELLYFTYMLKALTYKPHSVLRELFTEFVSSMTTLCLYCTVISLMDTSRAHSTKNTFSFDTKKRCGAARLFSPFEIHLYTVWKRLWQSQG